MRRLTLSALLLTATAAAGQAPDRWEGEIRKFEEQDRACPPAAGQVVFVGSSSIRLWKLDESFPGLGAINRGFGGSQTADAARYAERIVTPYKPRAVVLYSGDNDLAAGKSPETVGDDYRRFVAAIRAKQPDVPVVVIGIKPSPKRWALADKAKEANRLIREATAAGPRQTFVDVWAAMLGPDGMPRRELYVNDELHLSPAGYKVWTDLLRPHLPAAAAARRLNVLWLIAEDFGPHLGCYGTKEVSTPNLDRLAAEGVRYPCFFTTAPVCSPSRSAFMTGMYQTTIGAHHHRSHRDDGYMLPDGVKVGSDWFRAAGYLTANVVQFPPALGLRGSGKTDWNFAYRGQPFDTNRWEDLKGRQPFFAQVNFKETHRRFVSPRHADPAKVALPPYYPDHPTTRNDWAQYLDAATELDGKVGAILRQLEADGLADSTVVVFFGDNGQAHVRGKQFCYDSGLNVPLIIRWPKGLPAPKHFTPDTVDHRLLASIDLLPTMLTLAGAPKPERMQGEVFLGESAGRPRQYVFGARDRCDETVAHFRTVRDARYRYIRNFLPDRPLLQSNDYKERSYPVWNLLKELDAQGKLTPTQKVLTAPHMPAEELYDLESDPHEITNLADRPEHRTTLQRLRGVLEKWMVDTNDQGRTPEPPEVARNKGLTKPGGNPNAQAITPRPE